MSDGVLTPLRAALMLTISVGSFICMNWKVALLAFGCIGVMGAVTLFFIKIIRPIRRMLREEEAILSGHAAETFSGLPVVRAYPPPKAVARRDGSRWATSPPERFGAS